MGVTGDELGRFLRVSRGRLTPSRAGVPESISGRRVPGLRREEVAVRAGVSVDYYTRLEQGRERNPSAQVLDAIGQALHLPLDRREHLFRLAGLRPRSDADPASGHVHPAMVDLLRSFTRSAAYVLGPAFDVLAANAVARPLLEPFGAERNMPRVLFTGPRSRSAFEDRELLQRSVVHALRLNAARFPEEESIPRLVAELFRDSPEFAALWGGRDAASLTRAAKVFVHPVVGRIELTYSTFESPDAPGQQLLVGATAPGSRSEAALMRLSEP